MRLFVLEGASTEGFNAATCRIFQTNQPLHVSLYQPRFCCSHLHPGSLYVTKSHENSAMFLPKFLQVLHGRLGTLKPFDSP